MPKASPIRILHVDGDTFFASCEVAMDASLSGRPVWVGGGRNGDGIVIAANRLAKSYGISTGTACFQAKRLCPHGVLVRPNYDDYRRISRDMFRVMECYTPTLLPASIDEGFLDLTGMERFVWRKRTAADYVNRLRAEIERTIGVPVSAGLGASMWAAKLATSAVKPGFLEIPVGYEREFLSERPLSELAGCGKRRERALAALGAHTFDDVAGMSSILLRKRFGIWGQQLWLFSRGKWIEPIEIKDKCRTTISSSTTLPVDEPDYAAGLIFLLSEAARLTGQLRRECLQVRELFVSIRFNDFQRVSCKHQFQHPQFRNTVINEIMEKLYWSTVAGAKKSIRQICLGFSNLQKLEVQPMLWSGTDAERWRAIDCALQHLEDRFGKNAIMTGTQFALKMQNGSSRIMRSKCPFGPREASQAGPIRFDSKKVDRFLKNMGYLS
ncbi:MAG: hypothetical protein CMO77_04120 [Verrucomicrobiales bacterium]|nr:hypothetical protein [Verrucomicrobiales bacterium]